MRKVRTDLLEWGRPADVLPLLTNKLSLNNTGKDAFSVSMVRDPDLNSGNYGAVLGIYLKKQ